MTEKPNEKIRINENGDTLKRVLEVDLISKEGNLGDPQIEWTFGDVNAYFLIGILETLKQILVDKILDEHNEE